MEVEHEAVVRRGRKQQNPKRAEAAPPVLLVRKAEGEGATPPL
jgi:hypothetical protein